MPDSQPVVDEHAAARLIRRRVAVVIEPGRSGQAALARAAELAADKADVTLVATVPQTTTSCRHCGGVSPDVYKRAVRDDVAKDLQHAATRLKLPAGGPNVKLLVEGSDLPLVDWIAHGGFDAVLLPARRSGLRFGSHPIERSLRGLTGTEVQIVKAE